MADTVGLVFLKGGSLYKNDDTMRKTVMESRVVMPKVTFSPESEGM